MRKECEKLLPESSEKRPDDIPRSEGELHIRKESELVKNDFWGPSV